MRSASILLAALGTASPIGPALAQVQQGSPNAANQSLSNAGQMRATQQNQTTQSNMDRMTTERGQNAAPPPPPTGPVPGRPAATGIR